MDTDKHRWERGGNGVAANQGGSRLRPNWAERHQSKQIKVKQSKTNQNFAKSLGITRTGKQKLEFHRGGACGRSVWRVANRDGRAARATKAGKNCRMSGLIRPNPGIEKIFLWKAWVRAERRVAWEVVVRAKAGRMPALTGRMPVPPTTAYGRWMAGGKNLRKAF